MLALAKIKRSKAVLKTFWNHVRNVRFHEILSFHDGIAAVRDDSGAYHVDSNWKPAYAHRFDRTYGFYAGRRAAVESVGEAFHIDLQGNPVYSQRYDWCGNFHSIPEGFRAPVRANDEQYYYVDHTGTKKLGPFLYAGDPSSGGQCVVYDFTSNPLIINSDGSKWVDANKNWIDVCVPHKGIARVKDSAGWFYVDQTGREVGKGRYLEAEPHYNGQARVKLLNGQWVVIDEKGRTVKELGESVTASQAALEEASQAYWKSFAMKYTLENSTMDIAGDSSSVKNYILHEILRDTAFEMGFLGIDIKTGDLKVLQRGELLMSKTEDIGNRCKYWLQNRYMNAWMGANVPTDVTVPLKNLHLDTFADIANNKETVKLSHDVLKSYARDDWKEIADPLSRILPEDEKSRIRVVVDLGGGHGMLLKELEGSHILPAVEKYMCIDRSEVLAAIDKDISCDKIEYLVGDLFDGSNLCQGDLYLMSRVLHDWPDERVIDILQQVRYHSPDQARLIIIDREKSAENLHSLLSLHMYLLTGAHERTYDEWQHLFSVSGWKFDKREYHNGHAIYSVLKSELPMPKEPVHEGNNIPQVNADNTKASVRKAVITVGGLATRMLPQSKVTPKALLPIVSKADQGSGLQIKPALSHTLDQLQNDGRITDVCIVCNPNELELLKTFIAHCSNNLTVNIELKVQNSPRGFGDAVLTARDFVGNEPFLLVLGDHLFEANCITDVLNSFDNLSENYETGEIGISGACLCDNNEVSQTGLLRSNSNRLLKQSPWKVEEMLEKPESGYSSFELSQQYPGMFPAQLGIDILPVSIFQALEEEKRKIASDMEVDLRKVMKSSLQEQNKLFACLVGQRLDIGNPKAYYTALQSVLENDFLGMKSTISSREHVNQVSSTPNAYHLAGLRSLLSSAVVPMPDFLLTVLNSQEDFHVGSSPGRMDVMGGFSDYSGSSALQYPTAERVLVLAAKCQRDGNDKSPASINMASIQIPSLHHMSSLEIGSNAVVVQEAKLATSHLFSSGRYKTADELQKLLREQFPVKEMRDRWSHYLVGMLHSLAQHNPEISEEDSFTLVSISDLPWNAGLASSAAVEVASAMAIGNLLRLSRDILNPLAVAQICQKVENGVVGGQCGIMDQLAVTHVESGINPMLVGMRCRLPFPTTATYSVPLPNGLSAVAIDSNVKRSTVSGQYQRVRDAATIGKQVLERCLDQSINYLCDIPPSQLDRHKGKLPFSVSVEEANKILSRNSYPKGEDSREEVHYPVLAATTFPIEENYRVLHFESILRAMNLRAVENPNLLLLGELMSQSHNGYVSCGLNHTFTDTLVQLLESQAGVVGAKSSGGGGGGAVVALVKDEFFQRENSFAEVQDKYYAATGATCNLRHGSSGGAKYHGILSRYFSTDSKKGRSNLKPRVLVANHGYPPDFNGGSEVYAQALALTLKRSGNCESVHVFAREHNPYRPDFELRRTVDQLDEYLPVYLMNYSREAPYFRSIAEEVDKAFAEVLEEVKPDVLHLHHMNHLSLGLPAVAKAAGVPVVYTLHDYWLMCPRGQFLQTGAAHNDPWQQCDGQEDSKCAKHCYASRYALGSYESATDVDNEQQYWTSWIGTRMAAVKEACNNIDVFIAPSHYLFDKFIGQFTLPPSKVLLEPYGFDRDRLVGRSRSLETSRNTILTDDKPFVFAYIGRHQPAKGINLLVEASLELLMGYPEATKLPFVLKIFGRQDSNSTRALLRMIDSCPHPLTKGILQFEAEYVNKDIIQKVFNEVDCIVVPSIWEENSPLVIHEALQCKVPVITSSAGGMGELIKNAVNGLTFEHRSSNSLSQTMRKAVEQPDGIRFLAERGYLYSNDGQIPCLNVHVNKLLTLYRNLTTGEDITATLAADSWYLKNVYNYDKSTAIDETYPTIESPTNSSSAPKLEVPWRITFDTNPDDCNFSCTMCEQHSEFSPHQKARKDQGIRRRRMDIELISKTIAELAPRGLKEVIPTTMGEPLMYKEFPRMIELCKEHGVKLNLTTNGSFYGGSVEAWAEKIVPVGSDVKISWNGITHETQQKIMKRSNLYTHINNLRRMIKVRDRVAAEGGNYCSVTLQLTFMEDNLPELPRLVEFAIEEGCDRVKGHHLWAHFDQIKNQNMRRSPESIRRWNDTAQQCRMIAASKSRKDGTHLRLDNFFDLSESTGMNEIDPTAVCPFLGQEAWVNAKGRFDPCCAPDLERKSLGSFGDINEDRSLMDVWNSDSYNDLVKNYKKKPLCKNCNMRRPIV